jgi:hypothetical protein
MQPGGWRVRVKSIRFDSWSGWDRNHRGVRFSSENGLNGRFEFANSDRESHRSGAIADRITTRHLLAVAYLELAKATDNEGPVVADIQQDYTLPAAERCRMKYFARDWCDDRGTRIEG